MSVALSLRKMDWTYQASIASPVDVQGNAFVRESIGVGTPKAMRVDALFDPGLLPLPAKQVADVHGLERLPAKSAEHRMPTVQPQSLPPIEPPLDHGPRDLVHAHRAGLVALAMQNAERALDRVQDFGLESQGFPASQPRAVQGDNQGAVANPGRCAGGTFLDQGFHFIGR